MGVPFEIAIDGDDVLFECVSYAIDLVNQKEKTEPPLHMEQVTQWEPSGRRTDAIFPYFLQEDFYLTQPLVTGAQEFIRSLLELTDHVLIASAVPPEFMTIRAKRIMEAFPELPKENIMLGGRKDRLKVDMLLDDAVHNIEHSLASCPTLMDKPWNRSYSTKYRVMNFQEFLNLAESYRTKRQCFYFKPRRSSEVKKAAIVEP